jgi:diguanylate cyclase (GGDEF)-like protein
MLDTRTFFFSLVATCLVFAFASALSVSFRFRDGMGKWSLALLLEAVMFVFYGVRGVWPDMVSIVVANTLFALALGLKASALFEFFRRHLHGVWVVVPPLLVGVFFYLALSDFVARTIVSGIVFGGAMLVIAIAVHRIAPDGKPARWMLMGAYVLGGFTFVVRGLLITIDPASLKGFLVPTPLQVMSLLVGLVVVLLSSIGFILLHLERAEEAAQRLAIIDPLTSVFNRRTFLELADKEIARAQRTQSALSLVMIDIDHFKKINDENGHQAGDEVLRRAVDAIKLCLRREDLLVRYGGEEFCILVPGVGVDQASLLAERAREAVQKLRIPVRDNVLAVTISAGVTAMRRSVEENIEQMVARADEALYLAKGAGRNRVITVPDNTTIALLARSQQMAAAQTERVQAGFAQPAG